MGQGIQPTLYSPAAEGLAVEMMALAIERGGYPTHSVLSRDYLAEQARAIKADPCLRRLREKARKSRRRR